MRTRILVVGIILLAFGSHAVFALQTPQEFFEQGNAFYKEGNYEAAAKAYEQVLSLGYVSPELYYNLGNAFKEKKAFDKAIEHYKRSIDINPGYSDAYTNLGLSLQEKNQYLEFA